MPLVLIPTPIGNLGDITLRSVEELKNADVIACEDTRHSGILLQHLGVHVRTLSYQKFNERERSEEILQLLAQGKKVALISDAGTPGMSDPGYVVLRAAIDAGYDVDVLPGATAFVPAVLLSGLQPHPFTFIGFLSDQKGERRAALEQLKNHPFTMVFYLSPHKAARQIEDFIDILGDRQAALVREISKVYQEARRGTLSSILQSIEGVKGELALVVESQPMPEPDDGEWQAAAQELLSGGMSAKQTAEQIAAQFRQPKNKVKAWIMGK
ncbi:MAG: 16S rRNA (cytidine(1402)-2'-O)-methyltransferase [Pyramidobacter sp.]|nr:16S rRNA (cytidine(1402)-2'-O)-methyltransferase [Pyramidobacter sp.]